jgi:hypothetical protein
LQLAEKQDCRLRAPDGQAPTICKEILYRPVNRPESRRVVTAVGSKYRSGDLKIETERHTAMKVQQRSEAQTRRIPVPELNGDKGRKHEAFELGNFGCDRRSLARAMRLDRKR